MTINAIGPSINLETFKLDLDARRHTNHKKKIGKPIKTV
jgi:hypothetical protein